MAVKLFTVEAKGIGKPDYSRHISSGFTRPGFVLQYNQTLLIFVITFSSVPAFYGWVFPPLAVGATASLINAATNLPLPYSILPGYKLTMVSVGLNFDQDSETWQYIGWPSYGIPLQREACAAQLSGGLPLYLPEVVAFESSMLDPTATIPLDYDLRVTNLGTAIMQGEAWMYYILEAVSTTPLPPLKDVKCKWCGALKTVPIETVHVICDKCGKLTIVRPLLQLKGRG